MIFNVTKKPFYKFDEVQRLATHAEAILHHPCQDVEEFLEWLNKVGEENVSKILVEKNALLLNNDIFNYVNVPACTLDVEVGEHGNAEFVEYTPEDEE